MATQIIDIVISSVFGIAFGFVCGFSLRGFSFTKKKFNWDKLHIIRSRFPVILNKQIIIEFIKPDVNVILTNPIVAVYRISEDNRNILTNDWISCSAFQLSNGNFEAKLNMPESWGMFNINDYVIGISHVSARDKGYFTKDERSKNSPALPFLCILYDGRDN